jgi:group I intron endonuclease
MLDSSLIISGLKACKQNLMVEVSTTVRHSVALDWEKAMQQSGIYSITNTITGQKYIGSSVDFNKRWARHKYLLRRGQHHSPYLQRAWDKYGESAFIFTILEIASESEMVEIEQGYLDKAKPAYNFAKATKSPSRDPEVAAKIGASQKGRVISTEQRAKISKALTGQIISAETRRKISAAHKGRISWNRGVAQSPETVAKRAVSNRGKKRTPEQNAVKSALMKGQTCWRKGMVTPQITRDRISAANKGRKRTPEQIARILAGTAAAKERKKLEKAAGDG